MDNIKYQVFISSTYSDLSEERKQILNILLMADCIPAGMESFVATDDEQFNVIKKVIDFCDYYILILGKRYGSVSEQTGISYTEMEYNYAREKEIPVLVFAIDDATVLDEDKIENDEDKKEKLREFKSKAMSNRLASVWKDVSDLVGKVAISIMRAKSEIVRPGWHRGDNLDKTKIINELIELRETNGELEKQLDALREDDDGLELDAWFYGKEITLHFTEEYYSYSSEPERIVVTLTLDKIFKYISLRLTGASTVNEFRIALDSLQESFEISEQDALVLKNKFEQLHLIESYLDKNNKELIKLTDKGKKIMNALNLD